MKVLLISNRKGGVGKTTLAANIANEISRSRLLTILIDMDSQCGGGDSGSALDK